MHRKILLEGDIRRAISNTLSNAAAARYLGVSNETFKKYASMYLTDDGTQTLYESHKNQAGVGISHAKLNYMNNKYNLEDILAGKHPNFPLQKLKQKLIREGLLQEKCELCGFEERRITDFQVPLLLSFKDGNRKNWSLDNLELLCYNCYFLTCGNIIGRKGITDLF